VSGHKSSEHERDRLRLREIGRDREIDHVWNCVVVFGRSICSLVSLSIYYCLENHPTNPLDSFLRRVRSWCSLLLPLRCVLSVSGTLVMMRRSGTSERISLLLDCGEGSYGQLLRRFGTEEINQVCDTYTRQTERESVCV
jgi:hypothetical protein